MSGMPSTLLTVSDLARYLRVGRSRAYALVRSKQIRALRLGRSVRIPVDALNAFVAARLEG